MMSLLIMGSTAVMVGAINNILGFVVILMYLIMMFKHDMDWFMSYGEFMLDSVSFLLIVLSVWISMFMYMAMSMSHYFSKLLSAVIASLLLLLMLAFASVNFILFYVFFEACLLPTLILILGWGYQPERTNAGTYMIIYTVVGSLPLLWSLLFMKSCGVVFMTSNISINIDSFLGVLLFIACFVAFLIKLPVYMVHLWLPKAHVEAPVGGSMILAGLLLKLGGYGLMRVSLVISKMPTFCLLFIMGWALFGGVVVSVLCLQQSDIKSLIALSSVVHMAMIVGGVCVQSLWGIKSALLIMVGHGLCSSGLFCAANLIYKWVGSRSISVVGGLQSSVPALSLFWFLLCSSNMSAPPSLSLLGEISGGVSIVSWSWWFSSIMFMLVLMSGAYSLFLYLSVTHGKPGSTIMGCGLKLGDMLLLGLHWGLLNIIFLIELNCVMSM